MIERNTRNNDSGPYLFDHNPDWSAIYTAERAEQELIGFKFKGIGWYFTKWEKDGKKGSDTILVVPFHDNSKVFRFHVYNNRNPLAAFQWVVDAPVQVDERFDHV